MLRKLIDRARHLLLPAWDYFHWLLGQARRLRSHVRKRWAGADPVADSDSEAVYLHFDRGGAVHDYVIRQLQELVSAGFRITFVSNAPKFDPNCPAEIIPHCRQILWRRNVGYDFGGYKDGIAAVGDLGRVKRLLLMDDSVYGPFRPLSEVLAAVDPSQTDMWGITDSWEHNYHIQSYFVLFLKGAIESHVFSRFWNSYPYVNRKGWVIRKGEIGLTQAFTQHKVRVSVLNPFFDVAKVVLAKLERANVDDLPPAHRDFLRDLRSMLIQGRPMNQSHFFWDTLVTDCGCPFLKREVILLNPARLPYAWRWSEIIARTKYDIGLILRDMQAH